MLLHLRVAKQSRDGILPLAFLLLLGVAIQAQGVGSLVVHKYSTRVVRTKYGPLRGIILQQNHPPVEAFLGVPYATPPVGSLRYMPPVTPSMWRNPRLADSFSPVCPQTPPEIGNRTEALLELPRGRLVYLEKLLPLLVNQSEDCLYLNIYVPRGGEYCHLQLATAENNVSLIEAFFYGSFHAVGRASHYCDVTWVQPAAQFSVPVLLASNRGPHIVRISRGTQICMRNFPA